MIENWDQYKDLEYYPDRVCKCGCEGRIKVRSSHKYDGIPQHIYGHGKGRNFSLVEEVEAILKGEKEAPLCECNCGERIQVLLQHEYAGIPKYIHGHNGKGKPSANKGKVSPNKNKTWEEIYGVEKAAEMREGVVEWTKTPGAIEKAKKTRKETYEKNGGLNHPPDCTCCICKAKRGETKGENNPFYGKGYKFEGEKNSNWQGGISKFPYAFEFNEEFKMLIRGRDNHICQLCGKTKEEEGQNLAVHHIYYDKMNDCTNEFDFITLCFGCNSKVNFNREYWTEFFNQKLLVLIEEN